MMFTRISLHVTDIYESEDTLKAAASRAKCTTPMALLEVKIENDNNNDLYKDLGGQTDKDCPIDNNSGNLHSHLTDKYRLDVATENLLILEMLLENQAQWKAEHFPE
jgi:hypothetical protein